MLPGNDHFRLIVGQNTGTILSLRTSCASAVRVSYRSHLTSR